MVLHFLHWGVATEAGWSRRRIQAAGAPPWPGIGGLSSNRRDRRTLLLAIHFATQEVIGARPSEARAVNFAHFARQLGVTVRQVGLWGVVRSGCSC